MSERGILFSAPMVRAILAGTKTQTRFTQDDLRPGRPRVEPPDDDEPPPKYSMGDRVSIRNSATGTVSHVYSKLPDRPRQYRVAFDGASEVGYPENQLQPAGAAANVQQMALFP